MEPFPTIFPRYHSQPGVLSDSPLGMEQRRMEPAVFLFHLSDRFRVEGVGSDCLAPLGSWAEAQHFQDSRPTGPP